VTRAKKFKICRDEFHDIVGLFKPVFHTMMLIWKHSNYYAQPSRIVSLMREICNSLIEKAMKAGEGLHLKEAQEAVDTLRMILKVLGTFKSFYFDYKSRLGDEAAGRQWKVQNSAIFERLDAFLERVHDVLDINQTCLQFSKLGGERGVEIGGTKGASPECPYPSTCEDSRAC
jgi:dynein heavy chain